MRNEEISKSFQAAAKDDLRAGIALERRLRFEGATSVIVEGLPGAGYSEHEIANPTEWEMRMARGLAWLSTTD